MVYTLTEIPAINSVSSRGTRRIQGVEEGQVKPEGIGVRGATNGSTRHTNDHPTSSSTTTAPTATTAHRRRSSPAVRSDTVPASRLGGCTQREHFRGIEQHGSTKRTLVLISGNGTRMPEPPRKTHRAEAQSCTARPRAPNHETSRDRTHGVPPRCTGPRSSPLSRYRCAARYSRPTSSRCRPMMWQY